MTTQTTPNQFGAGSLAFVVENDTEYFCYSTNQQAIQAVTWLRATQPDKTYGVFDKDGYIIPSSEIETEFFAMTHGKLV